MKQNRLFVMIKTLHHRALIWSTAWNIEQYPKKDVSRKGCLPNTNAKYSIQNQILLRLYKQIDEPKKQQA